MDFIGIIIYALFGLLTLIGLLAGRKRGIGRQSVRLFTVALSVLIAFLSARGVFGTVSKQMTDEMLADLLTKAGMSDTLGSLPSFLDADLVCYILALPIGLLVAPIVFVFSFILISGLMLVVHKIISRILGFKCKNNTKKTRLLGMALGAVQGILVTATLLIPVYGLFKSADDAITTLETNGAVESETLAGYHEVSEVVCSNLTYKVFSSACKDTYDSLSVVKLDGEKIRMTSLFDTAVVLVANGSELGEIDFKNLTDESKATIDNLVDAILADDYLLTVSSGIVSALAETGFDFGSADGSTAEPPESEPTEPTVADKAIENVKIALFDILKTMTPDYLKADIMTLKDVLYLVADSGLLGGENSSEDMISVLIEPDPATGDNLIAAIIRKIENNSHLNPLVSVLNDAALSVAFDSVKIEGLDAESAKEMVGELKTGLNSMLAISKDDYTPDEYKEQISTEVESVVESALKDMEFELSEEEKATISDEVANYIIENDMLEKIKADGKEELTDADVINIISQYYSVLAPESEGEGAPSDAE